MNPFVLGKLHVYKSIVAKTKRRNKGTRIIAKGAPATATPKEKNDLAVAKKISKINTNIMAIGVIPYGYYAFDLLSGDFLLARQAGPLMVVCTVINLCLMRLNLGINAYAEGIYDIPKPPTVNLAKYRKLGVWQITISIFIVIVAMIPILYAEGYIARFANLLPGKEQLGNKVSLGMAFGLGAIVSGVVGNLAYDVLKFALRKMMNNAEH